MAVSEKEKIVQEVEKYLAQGMLDKVESLYRKLAASPQIDSGVLNRIGDLYLRYGKVSESIRCFRQLAEHYNAKGFDPQAAAIWKKIIKISPAEYEAYYKLAELYERKKLIIDAKRNYFNAARGFLEKSDFRNAIKAYEKLQLLEPDNLKLKDEIATILIQLGQNDRAAESFLETARILESSGNIEDSIKSLRRAISLNPKYLKEAGEFIEATFAKGLTEAAMLLAEDLFLSMPERGETGATLANLFVMQKNYSDAHNILNRAMEANAMSQHLIKRAYGRLMKEEGNREKSFEWYCGAADGLVNDGHPDEAINVMNEYCAAFGDDTHGLEKLAEIYKLLDDHDKILQCYKKLEEMYQREGSDEKAVFIKKEIETIAPSVDMSTGSSIPEKEEEVVQENEIIGPLKKDEFIDEQLTLSRIYAKYDMNDRALVHLEQVVSRFPDEYEISEKLIEKLGSMGEKEKASSRAIEIAAQYDRDGRKEKAISLLKKAAAIHPEDQNVALMLAEISARRRDGKPGVKKSAAEKARKQEQALDEVEIKIEEEGEGAERITTVDEMLKVFREKVKNDVDEDDYKTHYELGIAYKEMDLIDEAISEFQHARSDPSYFIDSTLMLSVCLNKTGEAEQAARVLEESIQEIGNDERGLDLKYELANIYSSLGRFVDTYNLLNQITEIDPSYRDAKEKMQDLLPKIE